MGYELKRSSKGNSDSALHMDLCGTTADFVMIESLESVKHLACMIQGHAWHLGMDADGPAKTRACDL